MVRKEVGLSTQQVTGECLNSNQMSFTLDFGAVEVHSFYTDSCAYGSMSLCSKAIPTASSEPKTSEIDASTTILHLLCEP